MTYKNAQNIALFSVIVLFVMGSFNPSNTFAEESEDYKMAGDVMPVLTFKFRDGVETHEFPVFKMNESFTDNSGVSFSVEGTVTHSPLLHKSMDDAYLHRYTNAAFDYQSKYFDIVADFIKNDNSIISFDYNNCRIDNYQIETIDSNDYESYTKKVGFAIVDKIDFVCSGLNANNDPMTVTPETFIDHGESGFKFINGMKTSVTFSFNEGKEKIEFPVFDLVSGYAESERNVKAEFSVEGILDDYPLLQSKIDNARLVSGFTGSSNDDFDALVELTNGEKVLRGFDFSSCRVSDAKITTKTDKEEGFTGKSGFAIVYQLGFECSGIKALNMYYNELHGDTWKPTTIKHRYFEPLQNTDKNLSVFTTFNFDDGVEIAEFSMFKQNEVLTATENPGIASGKHTTAPQQFTRKTVYPTFELRGIVGDYPLLYNHVDDNLSIQGVTGNNNRKLVDIDVQIVSGNEILREFTYSHCRSTDYVVSTNPGKEESYFKGFVLENIFEFECQGYQPNNPAYDEMFSVEQANTESTNDLRNTDRWAPGFTMQK